MFFLCKKMKKLFEDLKVRIFWRKEKSNTKKSTVNSHNTQTTNYYNTINNYNIFILMLEER